MSTIDQIVAIIGPPLAGVASSPWVRLDGEFPGEDMQACIARLPEIVAGLDAREGAGRSAFDEIFSDLTGLDVSANEPVATYFEKEEDRYPAIHFRPDRILDADGVDVAGDIDEMLRTESDRERLAELLGTRLGVTWVRVLITFGPSER